MKLVPKISWRKIISGTLFANTARESSRAIEVGWIKSKVVARHSLAPARTTVPCVMFSFVASQNYSLLILAGIIAISFAIVGVVTQKLSAARALREFSESKAACARSNSILALRVAVATGSIMFLFESLKMVLCSGIAIWTSHLITIFFTIMIALVVTFAVSKRQDRLRHALAQNEERYTLLFEKSLTGAYRAALDGLVLDCNVSFCQMFGYETREEFIGRSMVLAYPDPDDRVRFIEKLQAEKKLTNFEQRLQRRDGGTVWVLNSATLVAGKAGLEPEIKGTVTDISEIRKTELENSRLAAIVCCSDDAMISCTLDGKIDTWNASAEKILGFSSEEVIGKSIGILAPPDRSNEYRKILAEVFSGRQVDEIETIRLKKNGELINLSLSVSPIKDAAGDVIGAAAIALDITGRKSAERKLRESEADYRLMFDANPVPMWVFDRDTMHFLAVNEAAVRQYGFSRQEFLSMTMADLYPKEDIPQLAEDLARRARGAKPLHDWRHRRKNREIIDVEMDFHDLDFHGIDAMLVAAHDFTARKQSEEALLLKTALLEAQSETTLDGILVVDESDHIILSNRQFELHFGVPHELMVLRDDLEVLKFVSEQVENPEAFTERVEFLNKHPDRKSRDEIKCRNGKILDRYSSPLVDSNGEHRGRIWYFREITERRLSEIAVRQAEEKYRAIFEDSVLGIFQITPEGRPISVNRALAQLHGFSSPEEFMAEVKNVPEQLFVRPNRMIELAKAAARDAVRGAEVEVYCKDRSKRWVRLSLRAARGSFNQIVHYEGTVEDITERKVAEERIQFLAYYDALTELPHRALLQDRLENALTEARHNNRKVALLFVDLDRFKIINDSLGHAFGDLVLKEIAKRLKQCTREQDTVARVGGDEFLIMLSSVEDVSEASIAAERIMQEMSAEFVIQGHSVRMSCSIGISIFPELGADCETLIKNADAAMYSAKEAGRNDVRFFTREMDTQSAERMAIENGLRLALDKNELFLVYQPQVEIATGAVIGFEALIRWQHPERGLVPPNIFIPIAEDSGLILQIGEWVLKTACAQARQWSDEGLSPVPIAVNVSAIQFRQENFRAIVKDVLLRTGLPAQYLELELTESLLFSSQDVMLSVLHDLSKMGVKLAIDDFGTGYSSLSYLKQFRVNKLKIDRSFIRNIPGDAGDEAITTAIISMSRSLNLKVIAEGVETEEQMSFLREHGCDEIQGYLFSKPLPAVEAAAKMQCAAHAA